MMAWTQLIILAFLAHASFQDSAVYSPPLHKSPAQKCVPITMHSCQDLEYNLTVYPNLLNHQNEKDAEEAIRQFQPLMKVKCSEDIKLFLCTIYAPVCTVLEQPIQPCRHLCQSARDGCETLMNKFGFHWPEQLECNLFPVDGICVGENKSSTSAPPARSHNHPAELECPSLMKTPFHLNGAFLQLNAGKIAECSLPCSADAHVPTFFDARTRRWLRLWTGLCAVACFFGSLFTICTFLIDLNTRFKYPVRPILYMALCYFGLSVIYMIGVFGDDRFACGEHASGQSQLVNQGVDKFPCSALAVAHYFFTLASCVWWVVLCLAWFLTATRHWGFEFIESMWLHFHALAWGLPGILSIVVLITNSFDGDVFTGICSVGNLRGDALFWYLVVPIGSALTVGLVLLMMGIFSMVRIRKYIKLQQVDVEKLINKIEKLMITGFSAIYVLATAAFAGILFYQSRQTPFWIETWYGQRCASAQRADFGFHRAAKECAPLNTDSAPPEILLFVMKYLLHLVVGVTCAIWVMSVKTMGSYKRCWNRVVRGRTIVATADDELMPMGGGPVRPGHHQQIRGIHAQR
ncbi:unnamed protein product, partial [Mesorhabditis spiculigera]